MKDILCKAAKQVLLNSYSPYSKYRVGAAIMAGDKIYTGANIENASYGLTICGERSAAVAAISDGNRSIQGVAVAVEHGLSAPCGACRQFLREFGIEYPVYLVNGDGTTLETTIDGLLPMSFGPEKL